jgi:branched-chain amino acid transport system substrate-binding protein
VSSRREARHRGDGDAGGGEGGAQKLTIYSSLPLQGAARVQALATVNGAKLALEQAGGDITLTPYGVYRIEDGALVFDRSVTPEL